MDNLQGLIDSSITLKTIPPMIPVLFYFLGTQSSLDSIQTTFKDRKTFTYALLFQITTLPLIGLILSQIFSDSIFSLSIAVVLLAPGGFISGILTHFKEGNIPLSVTLTSITSLVSPLTTVLWLSLISVNLDDFNFNILQTFIQLALLIFTPYILGFYLNRKEVKIVKKGLIKLCWSPNKAAGITPKLYIALRLRSVGRVLCQRKIKQQIAMIE